MPARKHQHARYKPIDWNDHEYVPADLAVSPGVDKVFDPIITNIWRRQVGRYPNQPKGKFVRPSPARDTDPVTVMCVIDCLMRVNPDAYINAGTLTNLLATEFAGYKHIIWNPTVVGRILSSIQFLAEDVKLPNPGQAPMISRSTYGGQRYYVIQPDLHTRQWLGALRDHFGRFSHRIIAKEIQSQKPVHLLDVDVWVGIDLPYGSVPSAPPQAVDARAAKRAKARKETE